MSDRLNTKRLRERIEKLSAENGITAFTSSDPLAAREIEKLRDRAEKAEAAFAESEETGAFNYEVLERVTNWLIERGLLLTPNDGPTAADAAGNLIASIEAIQARAERLAGLLRECRPWVGRVYIDYGKLDDLPSRIDAETEGE